METKISKALYELLKELYQSRAAKEFVDAYEREEQVREWSSEDFDYWLKLSDSVRRKMFPDHVCDEEKHESPKPESEKPEVGDIYRDVFGKKLVVVEIDSMNYGNLKNVIFYNKENERKLPLEEFVSSFRKM